MPEILVVGAGISGLSAALFLARSGQRARVIDRAPASGGLAGAEYFRGIPCDLGSHRLHPAALADPLLAEIHAARPFLSRPRRGVILFADRRLSYPPSPLAMIGALGLGGSLSVGRAMVRQARRRALPGWDEARSPRLGEDVGFARFVTDRVGERAYEAFYRPYAEKVWGLDPEDLSQTVAKKRVSATSPWALIRRARFLYPAQGIASITGYLEDEVRRLGVPIDHDRAFDPREARGRPVLFAGNIADLVRAPLEHRGIYLVYLAIPTARIAAAETYYAPDARYWFGRVSEIGNYSPALRREGETILCVEIPEGAWDKGVDFSRGDRLAALLDQLAEAGILPPGTPAPIEVRQRFVPFVYPLYRRGWIAAWREAMREISAMGNILPFGRQALFLHCNIDHCIDIARAAVSHARTGASVETWIERASAYLEVRVRD